MTNNTLIDNVIKQALIEYVSNRSPDSFDAINPTLESIKIDLCSYVKKRYGAHSIYYQEQQLSRISLRIQAALLHIKQLSSTH